MNQFIQKFKTSTLKKLFGYIKPYRFLFAVLTILSLLLSGVEVVRTYLFKIVIDDYIMLKNYNGTLVIVGLMLFLLIFETLGQGLFGYNSANLGQSVIRDIRQKVFKDLIRFKMKYFDQTSVGVLVTRVVNDMERIGEVFSSGLFEIFSDSLKMVVVLGVMFYTDWQLTILVLLTLPVVLYATRWFQNSMNKAFSEVRMQVASLNSFVQEHISGMKIVQLFTREKAEYQKFKQINEKHKKAWLSNIWLNSIFFPFVDLISSIAIGLIVWYGGLQAVSGEIQLGTIFMFIQLTQKLYRPLRQIADKFNSLQMGIIACERVFDILDKKEDFLQKDTDDELIIKKGEISFKDVRFFYKEDEEILKGISFDVKSGEKVAIVGATGAGKSTIINLITRFYELKNGSIYIDNQDITKVSLNSLRKHIGVVLQDVFLFSDTIYNNITLGNEKISLDDVKKAAEFIGIDDFFEKLPGGYHYNVKERGLMLSAGQRQLIAFLRVFVNQPEILILDEATSSVDTISEKLIQKATDKITQKRTSIIIAHRLSTIQKADKIIVLNKGVIVEQGSHNELLQNKNGYYYNLVKASHKFTE